MAIVSFFCRPFPWLQNDRLKVRAGDIKSYLLQNLYDIPKSYNKYHIYRLGHIKATTASVSGAPLCLGYCCLPIPQAVTSQAGHIKQLCGPFYHLVDIENDRIEHFWNIFTLLL